MIGRNIQKDDVVTEALNDENRPLPKFTGITRFLTSIIELLLTFVISLIPFWNIELYHKIVYHSWFKDKIKSMHKKEEVQTEEEKKEEEESQKDANDNELKTNDPKEQKEENEEIESEQNNTENKLNNEGNEIKEDPDNQPNQNLEENKEISGNDNQSDDENIPNINDD